MALSAHAFSTAGQKFRADRAADDAGLKTTPDAARLDLEPRVAELAVSTGLALVAALRLRLSRMIPGRERRCVRISSTLKRRTYSFSR
jgi:hypothetical protein